ncbi:hypothetical protein [Lichenicoccus roseus]|nr:hypothetical protein [Lichenicoccus roseus]
MTIATRRDRVWSVAAPEPVGAVASLLERLRGLAAPPGGAIAFGIDCPLGLPRAYVERHPGPADDFRGFLASLAADPGYPEASFLQVCAGLNEVDATRPFYPARGVRGMSRAAHAAALGLASAADLSRRCDRATATRPAGAPVFWTLGANQSGKAAISAWRELVLPELCARPDRLRLWPFDGTLAACVATGGDPAGVVTLAETYPAEALDQLGLRLACAGHPSPGMRGSKRRQDDRAALGGALLASLDRVGAAAEPRLRDMALSGFGSDPAGEDRFDSVAGLLCVLSVLGGFRRDHVPDDAWVRRWEGWVLGQGPGDTGSANAGSLEAASL